MAGMKESIHETGRVETAGKLSLQGSEKPEGESGDRGSGSTGGIFIAFWILLILGSLAAWCWLVKIVFTFFPGR